MNKIKEHDQLLEVNFQKKINKIENIAHIFKKRAEDFSKDKLLIIGEAGNFMKS